VPVSATLNSCSGRNAQVSPVGFVAHFVRCADHLPSSLLRLAKSWGRPEARLFDKEIYIAGKAGVPMKGHGVAPDKQVPNSRGV